MPYSYSYSISSLSSLSPCRTSPPLLFHLGMGAINEKARRTGGGGKKRNTTDDYAGQMTTKGMPRNSIRICEFCDVHLSCVSNATTKCTIST